ncbi:unnamed protein product, partial [Rotaria socialis]
EKLRQDAERAQAATAAVAASVSSTTTNDQQPTENITSTEITTSTTTEPVISLPSSLQHIRDIVMTSPELQRSSQLYPSRHN